MLVCDAFKWWSTRQETNAMPKQVEQRWWWFPFVLSQRKRKHEGVLQELVWINRNYSTLHLCLADRCLQWYWTSSPKISTIMCSMCHQQKPPWSDMILPKSSKLWSNIEVDFIMHLLKSKLQDDCRWVRGYYSNSVIGCGCRLRIFISDSPVINSSLDTFFLFSLTFLLIQCLRNWNHHPTCIFSIFHVYLFRTVA